METLLCSVVSQLAVLLLSNVPEDVQKKQLHFNGALSSLHSSAFSLQTPVLESFSAWKTYTGDLLDKIGYKQYY